MANLKLDDVLVNHLGLLLCFFNDYVGVTELLREGLLLGSATILLFAQQSRVVLAL
jgi:hypothetical protein